MKQAATAEKKSAAPATKEEPKSEVPTQSLADGELADGFEMPEDFQELGGGEFHPWVDKKNMVGKPFVGILKGRFQKQGKKTKGGFGFTIKLEKTPRGGIPCITSDPETRERKEVVCRAGEFISLDHTKSLDELQTLLDGGGVYRVFLKIKEVRKLESGNDFYDWQKGSKCVKAPPRPDDSPGF